MRVIVCAIPQLRSKLKLWNFETNLLLHEQIAVDVDISRYGAENAALFREVKGRKLLACLVGDSLLEVTFLCHMK